MASPVTLQLGAWSWQNEYNGTTAFVAHPSNPNGTVLDLNDGATFTLVDSGQGRGDGLDWGKVEPTLFTSQNSHTHSKRVPKRLRNDTREVKVKLFWGQGSSYTTWIAALRTLLATCEGITQEKPACLKVQVTNASTPLYLDVVAASAETPYSETLWAQLAEDGLVVTLTCQPFFRGGMQTLQNCATNPGFEAPSGPGTVVFNDPLANFNAYANQYWSIVLADAPVGFFPLSDAVGSSTAAEQSGIGTSPAAMTASSITFGGTGAIQNDPNTSASASGTGTLSSTMTGLSTGSANWSLAIWVNIASTGHGAQTVIGMGDANVAHGCAQIQITNTGTVIFTDGTAATAASAALSTGVWHLLAATYDGATIRGYIDNTVGNTVAATCAISGSGKSTIACRNNNGVLDQKYTGNMAYAEFTTTTLSANRIAALYNIGSTALTTDTLRYPDAIIATSPLRYYRLDEPSGTVAADATGNANASYSNAPTLGATGALTGDADTAVTLAAASTQRVIPPSSGLPTGNAAISIVVWLKIAAAPGSSQYVFAYGNSAITSGQEIECFVDTTPHINVAFGGSTLITSAAISTGAFHMISVTWNGTTLTLKIDNNAQSTATPGANAIPSSSNPFFFGARANGTAFLSGTLDEAAIWSTALTNTQLNTFYTAATNSPTSTPNTMVIPQNGRYLFGDPNSGGQNGATQQTAWTAVNQWQIRFRWVTGLTASFYLHSQGVAQMIAGNGTTSNGNIAVTLSGTTLSVIELDPGSGAGTSNTLATQSVTLTNGMQYWVQITQFPTVTGPSGTTTALPQIQAVLYADTGGAIGTKITTAGPAAAVGIIAQSVWNGPPQLAASGATLALGGNFSAVHTLSLFGPGGWTFSSSGTGTASGIWEQMQLQSGFSGSGANPPIMGSDANLYTGGVTTSYGAAAITFPPFGNVTASWANANLTSAATIINSALYTPKTHTWQLRAWVQSSNLPNSATIALTVNEYTTAGALIGSGTVSGGGASVTGNQASYTQLVGSYTSSNAGNLGFFVPAVTVTGTATSTTYTTPPYVWIENVQVWDNVLGASMPYCELFFSQTPAQLMVSGLLGDVPAPVSLSIGTIGFQNGVTNLTAIFGRRGVTTAGAVLVGSSYAQNFTGAGWNQILDTTSYGGWYLSANNIATALPSPEGLWTLSYEPSLPVGNSAASGTYELYCRYLTGQTTPNIGNVTVAARVRQDAFIGVYPTPSVGTEIAQWQSVAYAPFSAASANWQVVDGGQIVIPPYPIGVLSSYPASYYAVQAVWGDSTGGGSAAQSNWFAAMPKDGGIIAAQAYAISNNASTPFYLYNDGITAHLGLPTPWASTGGYNVLPGINIVGQGFANTTGPVNAAGGPGSSSSAEPVVNPTADSFLTVDPALLPASSGGVNQFVAILTDSTGFVYPVYAQINYSPLYLYPK